MSKATEILAAKGQLCDAAKVMVPRELGSLINEKQAFEWVKTGVWNLSEFTAWVNAVKAVEYASCKEDYDEMLRRW